METQDEIQAAQRTVEFVEKLEALTKKEGWKEFQWIIQQLLDQESMALVGQELDQQYYRKIGFLQMMRYVKELPTVVKDKRVREYLLHQGRAKALQTAQSGLFRHYKAQKAMAIQKLRQIMGQKSVEANKDKHAERIYREQG